ncbi:hypothetical protein JZU69_04125 [bacterium]|nr:hypothetical protein [bacterium]
MEDEWNSERWGAAIFQWFERDPDPLEALLRDEGRAIPDFVREFLADLASGTLKRGKGGRPVERDAWKKREIAAEVFAEWERLETKGESLKPKQMAFEVVAVRRGATPDAIRGVVDRLMPDITFDAWKKWGRPNWKQIT